MASSSESSRYAAPWGASLTLVTLAVSALLGFVTYRAWPRISQGDFKSAATWLSLLPVLLLVGTALFTIRGYVVTPDAIYIQRLLWRTRLPRAGLQSATFAPSAVRKSLRLFGNGGLFAATGLFRSPALGRYRAFMTDSSLAVVLRYAERTIVVSPHPPEAFVNEVTSGARSSREDG